MKLVKQKVELIKQKPGTQGILEMVEIGARNCYKSEGLIQYDSQGNSITAPKFVDKIVNVNKHGSVAEHGAVYLRIPADDWRMCEFLSTGNWARTLYLNPYVHLTSDGAYWYVSTNYRVILDNQDLQIPYQKYLSQEPHDLHERRITVRFVCDRSLSHQLVRHRKFSFSMESLRYNNYTKDKYGSQLTFIIPIWAEDELLEGDIDYLVGNSVFYEGGKKVVVSDKTRDFLIWLKNSEEMYFKLIKSQEMKPEDARGILPEAIKTELVVSGFFSDWLPYFSLRTDSHAQAPIRHLSLDLLKLMQNEMSFLWE